MATIEDKIRKLPPEAQQEVRDFVDFLAKKHRPRKRAKLKLDWIGALSDMRDEYTSVELQHKILPQFRHRLRPHRPSAQDSRRDRMIGAQCTEWRDSAHVFLNSIRQGGV